MSLSEKAYICGWIITSYIKVAFIGIIVLIALYYNESMSKDFSFS